MVTVQVVGIGNRLSMIHLAPASPSMSTTARRFGVQTIPMLACGVLVHHCRIWSMLVVATACSFPVRPRAGFFSVWGAGHDGDALVGVFDGGG